MATHSNAWRAAAHQHATLESVANYRSLHSSEQRALLDLAEQMLAEIAALESENQEKQAQIDAMRPVVEALAKWGIGGGLPVEFYHQARAFVAAHPTATAAGEAESEA